MASGNTIIVGGGIASGTPFTTNNFALIGNSSPATIVNANARQDASTPPKVYIGDGIYTAGLLLLGGGTANTNAAQAVVVGEQSRYTPSVLTTNPSVIIGYQADGGTGSQSGNVVIGPFAGAGVATGVATDLVAIGRAAGAFTSGSGTSCVFIGAGARCDLGSQLVVVGASAAWTANNVGVVVGYNSVVSGGAGIASVILLGANNSTNKTRNLFFGHSLADATTAGDLLVFGQSWTATASMPANAIGFFNSSGYTTLIVGKAEVHAAPQGLTFRLTDGLGANIGAGSLTIRGGNATGAGAQSSIIFQTQSAAGGASVLGTMTTQVSIIPCTGGAGQANLRFDNLTSGAGAGAGTLANAPAAGNPTFWLPVNIAGTVRYIPCW